MTPNPNISLILGFREDSELGLSLWRVFGLEFRFKVGVGTRIALFLSLSPYLWQVDDAMPGTVQDVTSLGEDEPSATGQAQMDNGTLDEAEEGRRKKRAAMYGDLDELDDEACACTGGRAACGWAPV